MSEVEVVPTHETEVARIQQFQREQLGRLHARPMQEVIPADIQRELSGGVLLSMKPTGENEFTQIYQAPNGIAMILRGETGDNTTQPQTKIKNLYYFDRQTGKAVDLSVLWGEDAYLGDHRAVLYDPKLGENHYDYGSKAVLITGFDFTMKEIGLRAHHTLFHELGHQSQDRFSYLEAKIDEFSAIRNVLEAAHKLRDNSGGRVDIRGLMGKLFPKESQSLKDQTVFFERNAHAFAIALTRRLRDEGIDLTRGVPDKYLEPYIETALGSYENHFKGFPGKAFTQEERKNQRSEKKSVEPTIRNVLKRLAGKQKI